MPAGRRKRSDRSIPINQKGLWFSVAGALLVLLGLCLALRPSSPSEKSFQIGVHALYLEEIQRIFMRFSGSAKAISWR